MEPNEPAYFALHAHTKALSVALGYRDPVTRLHSARVLGLSEAIAAGCNMSGKELSILRVAASFHDIGKIGVPDHVLLKSSQLDGAEWEEMKRHPEMGERILAATEIEGSQQASLAIRHHHEHFNGLGYPDGLSGRAISVCSRIISIADSYDAMAVTRSYHQGKTHLEIMAVLHKETGEKHDPELMDVFCEVIECSKFRAAMI